MRSHKKTDVLVWESVLNRLSRAVFWWVFSFLKLGKRKTIVAEDIPGLTKEHQSVVLAKRLRECFQRERAAQDKVTTCSIHCSKCTNAYYNTLDHLCTRTHTGMHACIC
jgi:hypothetical protein